MDRIVAVVTLLVLTAPVAGAASAAAAGTQDDLVAITIHVTDVEGEDVGGANVTVEYGDEERTDRTRSNGVAVFDVPAGTSVTVHVEAEGLVRNHPERISNVEDDREIPIVMHPPGDATVTVVEEDGTPIEGAQVRLRKDGQHRAAVRGTTDADGTLTAPAIEQGEYGLSVVRSGYHAEETTLTVGDDASAEVALTSGDVKVDFEVVDSGLAEPEPIRADITITQDGDRVGTFRTNDRGLRGIDLDANAEYEVLVERDGYDPLEADLTVEETDIRRTYEIERADALSVETRYDRELVGHAVRTVVTDEYGDPVEGADVLVDGDAVATTDADGVAEITVERAGVIELTATIGGVTSPVTVLEGIDPDADESDEADGGDENDESDGDDETDDGDENDVGDETDDEETAEETESETDTESGTDDADTETDVDDSDGGGDGSPGFGAVATIAALAALTALIGLRR